MSAPHFPQTVTSVLVEADADSVTVAWRDEHFDIPVSLLR